MNTANSFDVCFLDILKKAKGAYLSGSISNQSMEPISPSSI